MNPTFVDELKKVLVGDSDVKAFKEKYLKAWFESADEAGKYKQPIIQYDGKNYLIKDILPGPDIQLIGTTTFDEDAPNSKTVETDVLDISSLDQIEKGKPITPSDEYVDPSDFKTTGGVFVFTMPSEFDLKTTHKKWTNVYNRPYGAFFVAGRLIDLTTKYIALNGNYAPEDMKGKNIYVPFSALPTIVDQPNYVMRAGNNPTKKFIMDTFAIDEDGNIPEKSSFSLFPEIPTTFDLLKKDTSGPKPSSSSPTITTAPSSTAYDMRNMIAMQIKTLEMQKTKLNTELDKINREIKTLEYEAQQLACKRETIDPRNKGGIDSASEKIKEKRKEITEKENSRNKIKQAITKNETDITKARKEMIALLPQLTK